MWCLELLSDYTLSTVIAATALFGCTGALIGSFTFMQRQSLLGDVISHATLPGIIFALMITGSKHPIFLLCGGIVSAVLGVACMHIIIEKTSLKKDAALGIILSVFFGIGLVLLTYLQQSPEKQHGLIIKYIFGNASTVMHTDLYLIGAISFMILLFLSIFWKEYILILFDARHASQLGYPVYIMQHSLTLLTILCIITGLQLVGVVLMSSFLIAPAAAARQWTTSFHSMVLLACIFGTFSAITGTLISAQYMHLPTGPIIVVIASILVGVSLFFAPKRGIYTKLINRYSKKISPIAQSKNMYELH
jgi:manganese/zinc/iron transport system permease protein